MNNGIFEKLKKQKPMAVSPLLAPLIPAGILYGLLMKLRASCYAAGLFASSKPAGVTVISIGNITLGGTGKTPMTIRLAEHIIATGKRVAVVSRGYGRTSKEPVQVVADGKGQIASYPEAADEPLMMAMAMPTVPIICSPRRVEGIKKAADMGAEVVILDDSFSHLAAKRDVNILLIDAVNPFGNQHIFPAGSLREPMSAISRADAIFITRANLATQDAVEEVERQVRQHSQAKILLADYSAGGLIAPDGSHKKTELYGKNVCGLCGIASPEQFSDSIAATGARVKKVFVFADHHRFTKSELCSAISEAAGVPIITTEKDMVRIPQELRSKFHQLQLRVSFRDESSFERYMKQLEAEPKQL